MITKLEDFLEEVSEKTTQNNQYPVLTSSKNGLFLQDDYFNKQVASKDNTGYKIIRRGEFTYRAMSDTGEFYPNMLECAEIGIVSPAYPVFRISNDIILPDYLKCYFRSSSFQRSITSFVQGSTRASMKFAKMKTINIDLPGKADQRKIVQKLDLVRSQIETKTKELVQLDSLIKARFVEMFGAKNKGHFSTLGNECMFYSGTGFPNKYQGNNHGDYPFYKVGDISKNVQSGNKYLIKADNYIDEDIRKVIKGALIPEGTVVFAKIGEALRLNRRAITITKCLVDNNAMGIKPIADDLLIDYFFEYMKNLDMQKLCAATTVPSVRKSTLEKEMIYIPDVRQQKQFATFVAQVDKSKFAVQKSLEKTQLLFDSLMQEYFG